MADTATKIPFAEAAAPSTPAANKVVIYAKSDGLMYSKDDAGSETLMSSGVGGSVATDSIWDAAGDLAVGTGSNTAARLAIGATNGMALMRVSGAAAWALPPGYEFDYVEITAGATANATTEATANSLITGNAVSYDGSTRIKVECWFNGVDPASGAVHNANLVLYDGSGSIGALNLASWNVSNPVRSVPVYGVRFLTPSNASHTYSVRGYVDSGTATWRAGAGGSGNVMPGWLRITKA